MSKNSVLLPEPLPDFLVSLCVWARVSTYHDGLTRLISPDIIERIESFLDIASGKTEEQMRSTERSLGINQVLVNEYQPGQGISVSKLHPHPMHTLIVPSQPHEDGPAFRPLVATISLGSHTVLDIHHYTSTTSPSPPMVATTPASGPDGDNQGRPIAAIPLAHLLVLPRSLLILSSSLYTSHLHGITPRPADIVVVSAERVTQGSEAVAVVNVELLGNAEVVDTLRNSGQWEKARGLTFRHAEKTLKGGALSVAKGAVRRF
jgi:alkylated DNA repair protein alkB family protein 6